MGIDDLLRQVFFGWTTVLIKDWGIHGRLLNAALQLNKCDVFTLIVPPVCQKTYLSS